MAVEEVGVDVPVRFGDSRSNRSQDIRAAHFFMDGGGRRSLHGAFP